MVQFRKLTPTEASTLAPKQKIWPDPFEIPIIGVTGEYASGKTLFGLTIDPKNTIVIDHELGSKTYETSMGFTRVDVPEEMGKLYPKGDHTPIHVFMWWRKLVAEIERGRFTVMVIDDISSIEQGLVMWVRSNPQAFGKTVSQYQKSEPLMWGDVKNLWKTILADLSTRVQTLVVVAHMRQKFAGSVPTKEREAKGLDTIMELATLYLHLRRMPDAKGNVPAKPSALVMKSRLVHTKMDEAGELQTIPVLTPVIPDCTPARIRHLMLNPVDYAHLKPNERVQVEQMTDDERLERQAQIAADSRAAAEAARDRVAIEAQTATVTVTAQPVTAPNPDLSGKIAAERVQKTAESAIPVIPPATPVVSVDSGPEIQQQAGQTVVPEMNAAVAAPTQVTPGLTQAEPALDDLPITEEQKAQLLWLKGADALNVATETWRAMIRKNFGVESATQLSQDEANQLIAALQVRLQERKISAGFKEFEDRNIMPAGATAGQ